MESDLRRLGIEKLSLMNKTRKKVSASAKFFHFTQTFDENCNFK
jgi:hypothetical protein